MVSLLDCLFAFALRVGRRLVPFTLSTHTQPCRQLPPSMLGWSSQLGNRLLCVSLWFENEECRPTSPSLASSSRQVQSARQPLTLARLPLMLPQWTGSETRVPETGTRVGLARRESGPSLRLLCCAFEAAHGAVFFWQAIPPESESRRWDWQTQSDC